MLRISTLGEYQIFYKHRQLEFKYKKTSALLIYLLLNRKPFARDSIAYLFWDKLDHQEALKELSRQIYFIRKNIPSKILSFAHGKDVLSLNISDEVWLDVFEFENLCSKVEHAQGKDKIDLLRKLIDLYKADFLENFYIKQAEEFIEWISLEQDRLRNKFINILNIYCLYCLDKKEYNLAIELGKVSLKRDSLQEEIHQKLIYAYNACKQKNLAIKQYEICKNVLAKEGFTLSEETETLYKEIKSHKLLEEEIKVPAPQSFSISLFQEEKPIYLLGRKNEINFLTHKLENIKSLDKKTIFISGPSGVGKTRLVLDILKNFSNKYYVLYGNCYQFQNSVSFHPFIKAFRDLFQNINYQIPVKGVWFSNLLKLFPELEDKLNFTRVPVTRHKDLRIQLFEGFKKLLINLSENHPVILFIDNWQWADEASLELMYYMIQNIQNAQVLFLINFRGDGLKKDKLFYEYLSSFKNNHQAEILSLKNITEENILDLFKEKNKKENKIIADYLYEHSSGNPFLLNEILKFLEDRCKIIIHQDGKINLLFKNLDELPEEILTLKMKDFIGKHLENLTPESHDLIEICSILEEDFDRSILEETYPVSVDKIINCLEELFKNRLLKEQIIQNKIRYSFIHSKIKDYVCANLSQTKRVNLHQTVAKIMEGNFPKQPEFYNKIAFHYEQGLKIEEALKYYRLSAEHSESIYQHREAVFYYKKLIEHTKEKKDLLHFNLKISRSLYYSGDYTSSLNFLNKIQLQTDKTSILIEILNWKIIIFHDTAQAELKKEILNDFKKLMKFKLKYPEKITLDSLYIYMLIPFSLTSLEVIIKNIKNNLAMLRKIKISKEEKSALELECCYLLCVAYLYHGNYKEAKPFINEAISLAEKGGLFQDLGLIYYHLVDYFISIENYQKAVLYIKKTRMIFDKINAPLYNLFIDNLSGNFYLKQEKFQEAYYYLDKVENQIPSNDIMNLAQNKKFFVDYFLAQSNIGKAEKYFEEYIKLLKNLAFNWRKIDSYVLKAKILQKKKKLSKTAIIKIRNLFLKALVGFKKIGFTSKIADIQYELSIFEKSINQTKKYKEYLKEALKNYKFAGNNKKIKQINNILNLEK